MKITVIGGGSTYTPELVSGFIARIEHLPLEELWLMDIDENRLQVVGGFAQRMVSAKKHPFKVVLSTDQRESISGSSYVVTPIRVGQMPARREDEYLGKRHGLVGQETTGIGGMAKALRTIPVILDIARDIRETAQGALLLNFANPSGLITEALVKYAADIPAIGVCNVPITTKMMMLKELSDLGLSEIDPEKTQLQTLGLNHLSWHRGFLVDGEDLWPRLLEKYLDKIQKGEESSWDYATIKALGMIPNYYLQYYYYTSRKLAEQEKWPPSRAEQVIEIEKDLLRLYSDPALTEPPPDLMKRGGAYYSTLVTQLIDSHHNDLGTIEAVNTRNNGAVKDWPADWVLELPCRIDRQGIHPLPADPLPSACFGLIAQVKSFEQLTVEAAVHGDRKAAYLALLAHPLGPSADNVQAVLDDMLLTHRKYLPRFWQ